MPLLATHRSSEDSASVSALGAEYLQYLKYRWSHVKGSADLLHLFLPPCV